MPGHVLKPDGSLNRGQSLFIWHPEIVQFVPVSEKGQTARKRGGIDFTMPSRIEGDNGVGMLNSVGLCTGPVGVTGDTFRSWR